MLLSEFCRNYEQQDYSVVQHFCYSLNNIQPGLLCSCVLHQRLDMIRLALGGRELGEEQG